MTNRDIKRALISVYDKTGIVDFARALVNEFGIEIISTGGTADLLRKNSIPVTLVEQVTGFPEMLDGRVKTLHPKIHAAILADRDNPEHMRQLAEQGIQPIDMVVVNLYPFEKTVADPACTSEQAIEMIDIGGPCLLRAAAKNHAHVLTLSAAGQYEGCLKYLLGGDPPPDGRDTYRRRLASAVFQRTSEYDWEITGFLANAAEDIAHPGWRKEPSADIPESGGPGTILIPYEREIPLRYGENPHMSAFFHESEESLGRFCWLDSNLDRVPSFNNWIDVDSALSLCAELTNASNLLANGTSLADSQLPACCVYIKHTNCCGAGVSLDVVEAYRRAYLGDPTAAMGGILAVNRVIEPDIAELVMESLRHWGKESGAGAFFLEVWTAPSFEAEAVEIIRARKPWGQRVRLLAAGDMSTVPQPDGYKHVCAGTLSQSSDHLALNEDQWKVVSRRQPSESEMSDLRLAWLIAKHTKSNAISLCKDGMLIGNGAGQMSRVMSCRIATWLARENGHAEKLAGAAAASDAFFPFADGPAILLDAGVTALIQPGGSKRDEETIRLCDERGAAMIFTGTRHFKH